MHSGDLIRFFRKQSDLTQDQLAEKLGVSKAYISAIESGSKTISLKQLQRFAQILGIPSQEVDKIRKQRISESIPSGGEFGELLRAKENLEKFLSERGLHSQAGEVVMVPVVGKVPAGSPLNTYEDAVDLSESRFPVPSSEIANNRCFFLRVFGDSMIDIGINEGDLVLINPEDREVSGIGRVMAVEVDGEVTLKTVLRLDDRYLRLVPENTRYAPIVVDMKKKRVRVIGTVLPFMARWNEKLK